MLHLTVWVVTQPFGAPAHDGRLAGSPQVGGSG